MDERNLEAVLRREARKRVEKVLNGMWRALGPLDREELGALLDGAAEGVSDWLPPVKEGSKA